MMRLFWNSLSGRLLFLTVVFVMLAEVLIFVPSIARFREDFLLERLEKGQIAALAVTEAQDGMPSAVLQHDVLMKAELFSVVIMREGRREPILMSDVASQIAETYDLRDAGPLTLIADALAAFSVDGPRFVRVIGQPQGVDGEVIEVVMDEMTLCEAMVGFAWRILLLSLAISAITATLVFISVNAFLLRPIRRVIDGIMDFREDPEDAGRVLKLSGAHGEIGLAERELARTQTEVVSALKQKSRLAALGEAVAKINHDLRNILASTQLLADRLEVSRDPIVGRVGPKLIASLDRAIRLCQTTLTYGKAEEAPPQLRRVPLAGLAEEMRSALGVDVVVGGAAGPVPVAPSSQSASDVVRASRRAAPRPVGRVSFENRAPADFICVADPDQLFRAVLNLARNAYQAIEASGRDGVVALEARRVEGGAEIDVVDDGPGLPAKARDNLFRAFKGSAAQGGAGLGLVIAADLIRGHGGRLTLIETSSAGTRFRLTLPDVDAADAETAPSETLRGDAA